MENDLDTKRDNFYLLKDRAIADFPSEYILQIFKKELFIECSGSNEGNQFSCEIK